MAIPPDCRHAFGDKKQWMVPLHETDPVRASIKVMPLVAEWQARIKAVRSGQHDPLRDEIDKLAAEFRTLNSPLDDAGAVLVAKAIDFAFQRVGGSTAMAQHKALSDARGDVMGALRTALHATRAVNALNTIGGADGARTPFLTYAERWEATLSKTKAHAAWVNILKEFDQAVGQPLERLAGRHVQVWIDDLLNRVVPGTVQFKLGGLSAYWKYLASHQHVNGEINPFKGREVKSRKSKVERAATKKIGFPPTEIPKLWEEAGACNDFDLSYAIQLSVYMGWRIEEVARLKQTDVRQTGGLLHISGGMKSEAGLRDLPVPMAIVPLVKRLAKRTDSDGYLIRSTANKWGDRGSAIGKRFSDLKTRLGYDGRRSFHSIRHSFASILNSAGTPLAMLRDLLGHETGGDVTLGYVDESELRERLIWLDKIRFDSASPTPETHAHE
jgi:integrase